MAYHFRYLSGLFKVTMQATLKKVSYLENSPGYIRNNTTDYHNKLRNNLNKESFINRMEDHRIQHQWFGMLYIYVYVTPSEQVITWKISNALFATVR